MIRTHIIPCRLPRAQADALNLASGQVYTGVLVAHWRVVRKQGIWLSEQAGTRWSDQRTSIPLHAHTIDAAQQGFYRACKTTRALRKAGFTEAKFPHWRKRFRTTIWKNTAIKHQGDMLQLSNGRGQPKIEINLPTHLHEVLRVLEVRLVYDKRACRYTWHLVVENSKQSKPAPGDNIVSVDLGEIHPAAVGDTQEATLITCRERRHEQQGHAKRLAKLNKALSRKQKGSRRYKKLVRARSRLKAKHKRVMRDMEHKVSRAIVEVAVEREASTLVIGDVRDVATSPSRATKRSAVGITGRFVSWSSIKPRRKASWSSSRMSTTAARPAPTRYAASDITKYPCGTNRGGVSIAARPAGFPRRGPTRQSHRDVVGQINILSLFKHGEAGRIPAPHLIKHRMPHNLRLMRT